MAPVPIVRRTRTWNGPSHGEGKRQARRGSGLTHEHMEMSPPSVRREMFIDFADDRIRPPSGGPCADQSTRCRKMPIKHCPPDGGTSPSAFSLEALPWHRTDLYYSEPL